MGTQQRRRKHQHEPMEGQISRSSATHFFLDLYKEKYLAVRMDNMKKAYPCEKLRTWKQTKSKWGKMCQQFEKRAPFTLAHKL